MRQDRKREFISPRTLIDSFSFTFTRPGTYGYFCSVHPKMTAKVVVQ